MDEARLAAIEARLQTLEDERAIRQLVSGYGYAMDGGAAEAVRSLFAEDGVYAVGGGGTYRGRSAIAAIASSSAHLDAVGAGCAHIATPPYIVIEGDRAAATCHSMLVKHGADGFFVGRISASRLLLSRDPGGEWRIDHRQNQPLDGRPDAPALLARLLEPASDGQAANDQQTA